MMAVVAVAEVLATVCAECNVGGIESSVEVRLFAVDGWLCCSWFGDG